MANYKACHLCKKEKETTKQQLLIELAHSVPVPLTMTVPVCGDCMELLMTAGIEKVRNTRIVLNT